MAVDHEAIGKEISGTFASIGRFRVIAELARKPNDPFSKHRLEAATGITRKDIKSSLERLIMMTASEDFARSIDVDAFP